MYTQVFFDVHAEKMCIISWCHFLSDPCRNAYYLYTCVQLCMRKCKISNRVKIQCKDYCNNTPITECQRSPNMWNIVIYDNVICLLFLRMKDFLLCAGMFYYCWHIKRRYSEWFGLQRPLTHCSGLWVKRHIRNARTWAADSTLEIL